MDQEGNFAVSTPLLEGDNLLELVIKSGGAIITTAEKTVRFDEDFSTGGQRLIYVDSVGVEPVNGESVPALTGTIVIDLDNDTLLGLIEDKHVVGISPDGSEIYTSDKTVISTDTHRELRNLAFTQDISGNGFIVSPDGAHLYSRDERLDILSNTLLDNLPINIVTGSSWAGAPIPGGPTISADSKKIYCCNNLRIIETEGNTVTQTSITGHFMSDIALTSDEGRILVSEYSYAQGRLDIYDANTFQALETITGLNDFAGEIVFSKDGQKAIVGSAGNARGNNGKVTVIDLDKLEIISQITVPLADNLATSGNDEFFVSAGQSDLFNRLGVDVYVLEPSGNLVRIKNFFLGINRFKSHSGKPKYDQIRRIVFKPSVVPLTGVTISGPTTGVVQTGYTFTANVSPPTATTPITYTWLPPPDNGPGMAVVTYTWSTTGPKMITVTATNIWGTATDTHVITIKDPTAITLLSFTAHPAIDHVTLTWETGTEVDNAGFNLHRATAEAGPYTKLNDTLIPPEDNAVSGASYTYTDTDVVKGMTYYYKLEDVDIYGVSTFHGPVPATAGVQSVYLPLMLK
jgi:hypothetical protein